MKHGDYVEIHAGTAVTRAILDNLGSPDDKLKIIHIAGTNGKGSTAEFFTRILTAAGKKTGTFVSPAVYSFYDQFAIDGEVIPDAAAEKYFSEAEKAALGLGATDFEIQTAGIIYAFFKEGCEYAVIECGMGGLYDATNAINKKALAVITSISLEHTAYLGETIEEICAHKAGIITGNCPAVGNAIQCEEAKNFLLTRGVRFADAINYRGGKQFSYNGKQYELSAEGCYQPYNAATAIEGAGILGIDEESIAAGIKAAKPKGRLEVIKTCGRTFILDGAHNPAAFKPLGEYLKVLSPSDVTIIFGNLSDKDTDGNLKNLSGLAENVIAVPCTGPRATTAEQTAKFCRKYFKNTQTAASVSESLNKSHTSTVAVCGSFTLLSEAKRWIENRNRR